MILFCADNHYDTHPGRVLYASIRDRYPIDFFEDDWSGFAGLAVGKYNLLMLNMIGGTCDVPPPDMRAEAVVKNYLAGGGSLLLLHGSSAAFSRCDWWRPLVGYRWVRPDDPDGCPPSTHPVRPYTVQVVPAAHPLAGRLQPLQLPEDEIYINLEARGPAEVLMQTTTDEGTFVQAYACNTPWGGKILAFLPGHRPEVVSHPGVVANICLMLDELLKEE